MCQALTFIPNDCHALLFPTSRTLRARPRCSGAGCARVHSETRKSVSFCVAWVHAERRPSGSHRSSPTAGFPFLKADDILLHAIITYVCVWMRVCVCLSVFCGASLPVFAGNHVYFPLNTGDRGARCKLGAICNERRPHCTRIIPCSFTFQTPWCRIQFFFIRCTFTSHVFFFF